MSFPASITTRKVTGRFVTYPDGTPAKGSVRIVLDTMIQGPSDDTFIAPFDRTFELVNGEFAAVLPATNDPQWTPAFYRVFITTVVKETGGGCLPRLEQTKTLPPQKLYVDYASTADLDLADTLTLPAPTPGRVYLLTAQLGAPNGIAQLGSDGRIPTSQLPASAGGSITWDEIEDKPATFPAVPTAWTDVTGKPSTFPSTPAWTDVTGKPSVFPPTAHVHATSDVTGLDAALASKATETELTNGLTEKSNVGHTHDFASIAGKPTTYPHDPIDWADVQNKPDLSGGGSIAWDAVTSKPSTFPPSAHVHAESDVTGLTASLAGKSDTGHTHTESDISGLTTDLAGKAATVHTHSTSDIASLDTALASKATVSDMTAALSNKADLVGGAVPKGQLPSLGKTDVGLGNVDNTSDINKPVSTAQQTALNLKAPLANPSFTGTVSGVTAAMVGLGSVDNTSDASKPISSATQTALNAKAPLTSPTFTGTVGGITAAMVGLGNVNNTSDANKPVSTATQTALNAKAPIVSPAFSGTPTAPTPSPGDNSTYLATTAFVEAAIAANPKGFLVLGPSDSVPGGTPAGTVIFRTAS